MLGWICVLVLRLLLRVLLVVCLDAHLPESRFATIVHAPHLEQVASSLDQALEFLSLSHDFLQKAGGRHVERVSRAAGRAKTTGLDLHEPSTARSCSILRCERGML